MNKKVIFLDRDGVINKKPPVHRYITKWEEFVFLPGAISGIKFLKEKGFFILIVTNQRGIARNLMLESDLIDIHYQMQAELEKQRARIDGIYYCPHNFGECDCRKPKPGLFQKAAQDHNLVLSKTIFITDTKSDVTAGKAAGCKTILMPTDGNLLKIIQEFI